MIPAAFLFFNYSGSGADGQKYWTRAINSYDEWRATWARRNDLHTQALERAAADRNLFINSPSTRHVDLRFPEYVFPFSCGGVGTGWKTRLE